jgi:hypothetical protein
VPQEVRLTSGIVLTAAELPGPQWVYPCTVDELRERLTDFPSADLEGLKAVRLIPSTRRNNSANGRYFFQTAEIHLYSMGEGLEYKLRFRGHRGALEAALQVEVSYGMSLYPEGASWFARWEFGDWRAFILNHVLAHEVGHHVRDFRRMKAGYVFMPRTRESEQSAEAYALRLASQRR